MYVLTFAVDKKKHSNHTLSSSSVILKTSAPDRGGGIPRTSNHTGKILASSWYPKLRVFPSFDTGLQFRYKLAPGSSQIGTSKWGFVKTQLNLTTNKNDRRRGNSDLQNC